MSVLRTCASTRKRCRGRSRWGTLVQSLAHWSHAAGLQIVVTEGMSCLGRIRLRWRTMRSSYRFQEVKKSLPCVNYGDCDNQNENCACSLGIEALIAQRPWMSLGDTELYLQGWFQALRWRACSGNIERRTENLETPYGSSQNGSGISAGA